MKKVALYIRVSSDEQKYHGLSTKAQLQELEKYCKTKGYKNYEVYMDDGISAGALKKRKALQQLLQDCRDGKVKLILFTKLDRWFRHVSKYHVIQDELDELKVPWLAIHEPTYETVTAAGRTNINIYLSMAQGEVERTSERIKAIMEYKLTQGQVLTGRMPFGYKVGDDKKPILDEVTAPVAEYILKEFENVFSKRELMWNVREKFDVHVTYRIITDVLGNRKYTGYFRGIPNYFPPIISVAQFDKNQEIINKHVRVHNSRKGSQRVYIFTGLLKCRCCGTKLVGVKPPTSIGYRCRVNTFNRTCENNKYTSERILEKNMLTRIKEDVANIKLKAEKRKLEQNKENAVDEDAIREELKRLNFMYRKGRIDQDEYDLECEVLEAQLESLSEITVSESMDMVMLPEFDELYKSFSRKERRTFWRGIVDHIVIHGREIDPKFLS